jgi:outer membrane receptor protein involved in Fe transport
VLPFFTISNISIRRRYEDFTFTFGVKNLFDHTPDLYSTGGNGRIGDTRLRSQEDLVGRSFFMTVDKRF